MHGVIAALHLLGGGLGEEEEMCKSCKAADIVPPLDIGVFCAFWTALTVFRILASDGDFINDVPQSLSSGGGG